MSEDVSVRNIKLDDKFLENLLLLNTLIKRWGLPFGIFAPTGFITVNIECSQLMRDCAQRLGIPVTGTCVNFIITNENDVYRVIKEYRDLDQMVQSIADVAPASSTKKK